MGNGVAVVTDNLDNQLSFLTWRFDDDTAYNATVTNSVHAYATFDGADAVDWYFYNGYVKEAIQHAGEVPAVGNSYVQETAAAMYNCEIGTGDYVFGAIRRVSVKIIYYHTPLVTGEANNNYTEYMYKAIDDGYNMNLELVGLRVTKDGVEMEEKGDMAYNTPYEPTGYGPPAIK